MSPPQRVVVVGGGLGGLSAGVALAARGVPVTLLEKGSQVGGYAVSFSRRGFVFDPALHVTAAGGPGQEFRRLLDGLGLGERVRFLRLREGFRVRLGARDLGLPNDYDALFDLLAREFPAERDGLGAFRRDLEKHVAAYAPLFDPGVSRWRAVPGFLPKLPAFLRHADMSARDYLARFVADPDLRAVLFQCSIFMGVPMRDFPAVNFLMMFHVLFGGGLWTIAGGGHALSRALAERLRELGGEILCGATAARIIVERGRARAVLTADGREHPAGAVVANANLPSVVHELVGAAAFPAHYLRALAARRPSLSLLVLSLGLDCPPGQVGIDRHLSLVFPPGDLDESLRRQAAGGPPDGFSVTAHACTEPEAAAGGRATVVVAAGADPRAWLDLPEEDYARAKERATADLLARLERLHPGVSGHVAAADLATPRTLQRYTGNPGGAILGFACVRGIHRPLLMLSRPPVEGLFLASAWTDKLGGFLQCVKAGMAAAGRAAREVGG